MSIWYPSLNTADPAKLPRVQYNALTGDWLCVDRYRTADGWGDHRPPVDVGAVVIIDFGSIMTGPVKFGPSGPDYSKLRPLGQPQVTADDPAYKEGFLVLMLFERFGMRTFGNNSVLVSQVFKSLFDGFADAPEARAGKLPICRILPSAAVHIRARDTTFYQPAFEIVGWTDRDQRFGERQVPPPTPPNALLTAAAPAPVSAPRVVADSGRRGGQWDELNDEIPF